MNLIRPVVVASLLLASVIAAQAVEVSEYLPVPYPLKPVKDYVFDRDTVLLEGIVFEFLPSRHVRPEEPTTFIISVTHPSYPEIATHQVLAGDLDQLVRVHSSSFNDGFGLALVETGLYRWGVQEYASVDVQSRPGWEARPAYFQVQDGITQQPASTFDLVPNHFIDKQDYFALARSWKRTASDADHNPAADFIAGDSEDPLDELVDQLDLVHMMNRTVPRPTIISPLADTVLAIPDFYDSGVTFQWTAVDGATGYFIELDKDEDGELVPKVTLLVRGGATQFLFTNNIVFGQSPIGHEVIDTEFNTMQPGYYYYRVRPVFLDGIGDPSAEEFLYVRGEWPSPTPTTTPDAGQVLIEPLSVNQPEADQIVLAVDYNNGEIDFSWDPARRQGTGEQLSNVTYVFEGSGNKGSGQPIAPFTFETPLTSIPSTYDPDGDGRPNFPSYSGNEAMSINWQIYAYAPDPQNPGTVIFSEKTTSRLLRVELSLKGFPGDVDGDLYFTGKDLFYLTEHYTTFTEGDPGGDPAENLALRAIRKPLDLDDDRLIELDDVGHLANFRQSGGTAFMPSSMPAPIPTSPTDGAVFSTASITLEWDAVEGAALYMIVFERPATIDDPTPRSLFMQSANSTTFSVQVSTQGEYSWRVRALGEAGTGSGFCEPQTFNFSYFR